MAETTVFDGQLYIEPVSTGKVQGGVNNAGAPSSFGNILIIDTGAGAAYGLGKGIQTAGSANQITDFVHEFNSPQEMKAGVKGGLLFDLAEYLYNPSSGSRGASKVFLIRAINGTQAVVSKTLAGGAILAFKAKDEGLIGNGTIVSTKLQKGYAITITVGAIDAAKYIVKFWRGTYRGVDSNGYLYDGLTATQAGNNPELVTQSVELSAAGAIAELRTWAATDAAFQKWFEFDATCASTGVFAAGDLTSFDAFGDGVGASTAATETYDAGGALGTYLTAVLGKIGELDCSIILALDNHTNAASAANVGILAHITTEASFKKFLVVGGGNGASNFIAGATGSSVDNAATLNSRYAILCHSGFTIPYVLNKGISVPKSSLYHAAMVAGRMAGLEPQKPLTYKNIRVGTLNHNMTKAERETALKAGVLHLKKIPSLGWVINQGINTLQLNAYYINNDGSSPEIATERISAQLNRELPAEAAVLFIGGNAFNVNEAVLTEFAKTYLQKRIVIAGVRDGWITLYQNVKAVRTGTVWNVSYDFTPNPPVNKIFTTSTIIDPTING